MLFVLLGELGLVVVVQHLLFGWMMFAAQDKKVFLMLAFSEAGEDTIVAIKKMLE